jgi:predicted ATP-dependent endonuclease of OLD family
MNINNYHAQGFKAIEDISIEPKSINLITGRNNTGKTSLLESINLCFNPNVISTYDVNAENIINIENDFLELESQ